MYHTACSSSSKSVPIVLPIQNHPVWSHHSLKGTDCLVWCPIPSSIIPITHPVHDIVLVEVIQPKQATTRNLTQFILNEVISIANACRKWSTMTELHNNLFHQPLLPNNTHSSFPLRTTPLYRTMNGEKHFVSISLSLLITASSRSNLVFLTATYTPEPL